MAERLNAVDIENHLKAMLQLAGGSPGERNRNGAMAETERKAEFKKQRRPRKKKKSAETEEAAEGATKKSLPKAKSQGNNTPTRSEKGTNQVQQKNVKSKKSELKVQGKVSIDGLADESLLSTCSPHDHEVFTANEQLSPVGTDHNTNQNSLGYDDGRRLKIENRPPKKDHTSGSRGGGSPEGKSGDKPSIQTDPQVLEDLGISGIFPLKKKSIRFPRANFFCRLCEFHCDKVQDCKEHMKDRRHIRRLEISKGDKQLKDIPTPSSSHLAALTQTVTHLTEKYGLSEKEMHQRTVVLAALQENLQLLIPNLTLQLYGSSVTGFALKTSDANVDIILPKGESASQALVIIYKYLKEKGIYNNVASDFKAKIPSVSFEDPETSTCFQLTVGNSQAHETTELLALYNKIDPRVRHLAIAFRFWAKICKVDQQMMGTMPAYVTTLLTVFYLQQLSPPVLPVLHEYSNPPDSSSVDNKGKNTPAERENLYCRNLDFLKVCWKGENTQSVGELWLNMVKFYSLTFSMAHDVVCIRQHKLMAKGEKKWSGKKLAVEDPFSRKRNVTRSVSSNLVFDYIYDCLRQAYKYFGTPRQSPRPRDNSKGSKPLTDSTKDELTRNMSSPSKEEDRSNGCNDETDSPLCNSTESSPSEKHCVSSTCENEKTNDRIVLQNFATNISNRIIDNAKVSLQDNENDLTAQALSVNEGKIEKESPEVAEESGNDSHLLEDVALPQVSEEDDSQNAGDLKLPSNAGISAVEKKGEEMPTKAIEEFAEHIVRSVIRMAIYKVIAAGGMAPSSDNPLGFVETVVERSASEEGSVHVSDALSREKSLAVPSRINTDNDEQEVQQEEDLQFAFSLETLTDGKGPAVVCSICQLEGHLKQACPEDKLPDLPPLPEMTPKHLKILSNFLEEVPADFAPTPLEVQERNYIVSELQKYIREEYPEAKLSLFGSSCNGFGFRHSDLDICMTFDQPTAEGIDCVSIIETLSKMLKEHRGFYNVLPITTAKVPIVKFKHRQSQLEGDISLYNTLAQYNTDMLQMYSMIDRRVEILGYSMKVFAKVCDIGDASRGSLSSYGYILMVLHYLQQCKPPVIPVLQELHPPDENPEVLVDGWNAWFFNDFKRLPEVWPDYGKNQLSVAELWMGMFRYYTEQFDFKEEVVCIRQHATLTRFEKLWNGRCIAIEDPFDLNHNLGAGLSRKMNMYIQKAFIKGRLLYCTPIRSLPPGYQSLGDYFFAADKLTEEAPPTDKCCRACGKIGHFVKECPIVRNRKQSREEEDKRKRRDFERSIGEERGTADRCCRICGKLGHFAKECPVVPNRNRKQREEEDKRKRREYERSLVEDRSLHTRRDNRNQEFARHSHEYVTSPRAEGRANWPLLPGGGQLDPYLSPGYPPHGMGQQGQFHMNRTSGSPRLMRPNPQHQREQVSPNSRWANPVMNQPVFYYNQSPGSNHTAASPGQAFGAQQGRGHSTSALFKPYPNVAVHYQQQQQQQQFIGQGRHQESFLNRQYTPRESERYDQRSGRKFKD